MTKMVHMMAVCNTVQRTDEKDGRNKFEAESPDECNKTQRQVLLCDLQLNCRFVQVLLCMVRVLLASSFPVGRAREPIKPGAVLVDVFQCCLAFYPTNDRSRLFYPI